MAEGGDSGVEYRAPTDLEPHPLNDEVYGDRDDLDEALVESIDEHGILEPIVADPQPGAGSSETVPTILSGHRRVEAAKRVGLDVVPVRLVRLDTDLERRERLLVHNQTREKTFSQKLREGEELERIERERAKRRQGTRTDIVENSPAGSDDGPADETEFGKTRERVAEKIGIGSGRTYANAKTVWEAAQAGDTVAKHEIEKLDRGEQSVHGAYKKVRDRIRQDEDDSSDEDEPSEGATSTSESSSPEEDDRKQVSTEDVVLSAHVGTNDEVFPKILDLHVAAGASVADVTYGEGVFWRQVSSGKYDLTATDIDPARSPNSSDGVDCRDLPYEDASFDCVVLDPPYAEGFYGTENKPSNNDYWITERYAGDTGEQSATYHEAVLELYAAAGEEASRVLREGGVFIVKMQDEVSRNEQRLTHIELTNIYEKMGFHAKDLFVVVRPDTPTIGRMYEQRRARKNHSYFLVFEQRLDA